MSHFSVLVIGDDAEGLLKPFDENGEWFARGSRWDWWVVGGRFTGILDPSYDPDKDERNYSPCEYCEATGVTTQAVADKYPAYQEHVGKPCIQCAVDHDGKPKPFPGRSRNWHNVEQDSDVGTTDDILARRKELEATPYGVPTFAVVTPEGEWHERGHMGWFGITIDGKEADKDVWATAFWGLVEANKGQTATVVDCHV
jgi:hypothetical protein